MKVIAITFGLFSSALTVFPTITTAEITACVSIETDLDRLACYDKESGRTPTVAEVAPTAPQGKWITQEQTSVMNDKPDFFASVSSEEPIQCRSYAKEERPILLIRCKENTTAIMMSTNSCHLTSSDYNDYGDIQYRVDSLPAKTRSFEESTSNDTLGLWSGGPAIPFIKGLLGHEKLVMRFTPFNENPKTVTFDITGIDEAIKPLRAACGW